MMLKLVLFARRLSFICATYLVYENTSLLKALRRCRIHAFITCKLDNCNSLLYGIPHNLIQRLQLVQNCAARLVFNKRKFEHCTPLLIDLYWLPIKQRIVFKILVTTYKALNGLAPGYITDLLDRYVPMRSLRSSNQLLLKVPSTNTVSFGDRAFSVAAPKLWNSVPYEIRSAESLNQFKSKLKTYLFRIAYF